MTSGNGEIAGGSSGLSMNVADVVEFVRSGKGFDVGVAVVALSHGVPLPPSIVGRVRVGFGRLIDGGFNAVARTLERRTELADFKTKKTMELVSKAAGAGLKQIPAEVEEAVAMSFLNEYALKHNNRSQIVAEALAVLASDPPTEDECAEAVLSEDWLNYFADVAAQKSDPEMRVLMGRILAGEIRRPGSFSPLTIHCLATLTQSVARKFELLCQFVVVSGGRDLVAPMSQEDADSGRGYPPAKLSVTDLMQLSTYGLVGNGVKHWLVDEPQSFAVRNRSFVGWPTESDGKTLIPCMLLTQIGIEMYRLVDFSGPFDLQEWLATHIEPRGIGVECG